MKGAMRARQEKSEETELKETKKERRMGNKVRLIPLLFASALAVLSGPLGCAMNGDEKDGGSGATKVELLAVEQTGGISGTADSTGLSLTFDADPKTLSADHIKVTGAIKGELSGTGLTRTLAISGITAENGEEVSVEVSSPDGYSITGSPRTAVVYRQIGEPVQVRLIGVEQGGGISCFADTTSIRLYFDADPRTLTIDDVEIAGATKVSLQGAYNERTLAIKDLTVTDGESVTVTIRNPNGYSIAGSPISVTVCRLSPVPVPVSLINLVQEGGTPDVADTVALRLVFDRDPYTLTMDDVDLSGATKVAFSGSGLERRLEITDITVEDGESVTVMLRNPRGVTFSGSPMSVPVCRKRTGDIRVAFIGAEQLGGVTETTDSKQIRLTFDRDPKTLTAGEITLSGATKGALYGTGTTRVLDISNITVANGEYVSIELANPDGYLIEGSPRRAVVFKNPIQTVQVHSIKSVGGINGTKNSTGIEISFDRDPVTLTASNFTVTGATKGALTGSGNKRTLEITDIMVGNGECVILGHTDPPGYKIDIPFYSRAVEVFTDIRPSFRVTGVYQDGGISRLQDTTGIVLTYSPILTNIALEDISLTGATKGGYRPNNKNPGSFLLEISDITVENGGTVTIDFADSDTYKYAGDPIAVRVYKSITTGITLESAVQTGGIKGILDSKGIVLTFDVDPATLTADYITVTGATKGSLSGTGATRTLALYGLTVEDGETIGVTVASPPSYVISGGVKEVTAYRGYHEPGLQEGQYYQGGIIAYILQYGDPGYVAGETHGLIIARKDYSLGMPWSIGPSQAIGGTAHDLGAGPANTAAIVNALGNGDYAASFCDSFTNPDEGFGVYSDWYLPSTGETTRIYWSRARIPEFTNQYYWTSTEASGTHADAEQFMAGIQAQVQKSNLYPVRPVRSF